MDLEGGSSEKGSKGNIKSVQRCPYCQSPFKQWTSGYWGEVEWQISKYRDDRGIHYELLGSGWLPNSNKAGTFPTEILYCPKCGRRLTNE